VSECEREASIMRTPWHTKWEEKWQKFPIELEAVTHITNR